VGDFQVATGGGFWVAARGKIVKQWLKDHKEQIEAFYLPSYSPALNPDEYPNGNLKTSVHSG